MKQIENGYKCRCGRQHKYPGYVYAHMNEELKHVCECGRINIILGGIAEIGNEVKFAPYTMPRATPADIQRIWEQCWWGWTKESVETAVRLDEHTRDLWQIKHEVTK